MVRKFNKMIDDVTGLCLMRLIRGESWRDIIVVAAIHIISWVDNEREVLNKKKKK